MILDTDFLIIGTGLAGLNAAVELADYGTVCVVTKQRANDSNTAYAQGGIASVMTHEDSFEAHVRDTLTAGAGLCNPEAVRSIVEDGPKAIDALVRMGVEFDRSAKNFDLTREGGHSSARILHRRDSTGKEIDRALRNRVESRPQISLRTFHTAIDLIVNRSAAVPRCEGAYVLDNCSGEVIAIRAKATLLATGGSGKAYLYTSNPDVATGDGVAMAFRAGARVENMEFIQFHPTCLYHSQAKSFLISGALRGEGGILRTMAGKALMAEAHPLKDLAPRDIVARQIDAHLKKSGEDYVTLDMTHIEAATLRSRFPTIYKRCLKFGIDLTETPIPVVPAAHYQCGGIQTDLEGQTTLEGLWAAGENASTGLHGANRLASNSLLESAVMSFRASKNMRRYVQEVSATHQAPEWDPGSASDPDESVVVAHNWDELRRTLWNYVGIVRSDKRLERAQRRITLLQEEIHHYYWQFKVTQDLIELRNLATLAELIVGCAQRRKESRGLHYTLDAPNLLPGPAENTCAQRLSQSETIWTSTPHHINA